MKTLSHIWALILLLAFTLACRAQTSKFPPETNGAAEPVAVPFQLHDGYLIVVKGRIGSQQNLNFVIDSGASNTVIDRRIGKRVGQSPIPGSVFQFNEARRVDWVMVSDLQLGSIRIASGSFPTADLSRESLPTRVDAIIGLDILSLTSFTVDYEARTLLLHPVSASLLGRGKRKLAAVRITVQGRPLLVLLDTGVKALTLYRDRVVGHVPQLTLAARMSWPTVAGEVGVQEATLPDVWLGGLKLEQSCFLLDSRYAPPGVDGYLGISSLHVKRLDFDFPNGVFHWDR